MKWIDKLIGWLLELFATPPRATPQVVWMAVCLPLTKSFEGCVLTAYYDRLGHVWTIGYGATGPDIVQGLKWTQAQADADLESRLTKLGAQVDAACTTVLTPNQKAALVDFAYNEGIGALTNSQILVHLAAGDPLAAMREMALYDKAGGQVVAGLARRRQAEINLFDT